MIKHKGRPYTNIIQGLNKADYIKEIYSMLNVQEQDFLSLKSVNFKPLRDLYFILKKKAETDTQPPRQEPV